MGKGNERWGVHSRGGLEEGRTGGREGQGGGKGKILAEGERPQKRRGLKPELPGAGVGGEGKSTRKRRSDDPRGSSPAGG